MRGIQDIYLRDKNCFEKNYDDSINLVHVICDVCTLNRFYFFFHLSRSKNTGYKLLKFSRTKI